MRNTERGIEVLELPPPEGEGVRVRVRCAGICGSDLHLLAYGPRPLTLGHEFAGVLDDETPVAVQPSFFCGTCDCCRAGREHLCRTVLQNTYGISLDGGLADEIRVRESCLVPLPRGVELRHASLVEPLAVVVHGINKVEPQAGQRVLVVGGGSIGLAAVAALRARGCDVDLEARHPAQLEAGERLGAGLSPSGEYDVVIEAAGTSSSLARAIEAALPGGTVVVLSNYWDGAQVPLMLTAKEVHLVPSLMYGHHHGEREFDMAAQLLASQPELPAALVTHRFSLDEAPEAFRTAADRASGAIKVLLEP